MRNQLFILFGLALGAAACEEQSQICVDTGPNATITDVLLDDDRLVVGLYHALSYCTGTDEKRFINERIEVDLATGEVFVAQETSNIRGPLDLPDVGYPLFRDSRFSSGNCSSCELVLRSYDQLYTIQFTTQPFDFEEYVPVISLEVFAEGVLLAAVNIDFTSEARPIP